MRVVASFNPDSNVLTYKSRTFSNGIYIPNYRRLGQFLYEIQVNNNTVEVGVLPDHLFEARGYRSGAPHGTSAPKATDVIITIPDENEKTIAGRQFKIVMYKVPTTVAAADHHGPAVPGVHEEQRIAQGGGNDAAVRR